MDNNYTRRPRKRVTKKIAQRRRIAALAIIILVVLFGIILLCKSCSNKDDTKGNKKQSTSSTTTTTTAVTTAAPIVTTTTVPVPTADPSDPNTITKITLDKYTVDLEIGESDMPWVTMEPSSSTEKGEIWESSDTSIATVDHIGNITAVAPGTCYVTVTSENNPIVYAEVKVTVISADGTPSNAAGENSAQLTTVSGKTSKGYDIENVDGKTYIDGILIANKTYSLPADYAPGLDSTTESQFNALSEAAAKEGLNIWLASGYRSYEYQEQIYNNYVNLYGTDTADTFSSRPGHSDHQTGFTIDVNTIDDAFGQTAESAWLAEHAHEYGFIIRYPDGKEAYTGYKYEPWHIRYIGVEKATTIYQSGLSLEEYYGFSSQYQ